MKNGNHDDEIDFLRKIQTWTLVNPPSDHQIDNQWTYKLNNDGIIRFKARLLVRDFKQIAGIDYHRLVL